MMTDRSKALVFCNSAGCDDCIYFHSINLRQQILEAFLKLKLHRKQDRREQVPAANALKPNS